MKTNRFYMTHFALRACACFLLLMTTSVMMAQDKNNEEATRTTAKKSVKKNQLPTYEMKVLHGMVYDAATKAPIFGARVQALNNPYYTAMTDETGQYTIKVPVFVTSLYISSMDYNAVQIGLRKGNDVAAAYLSSTRVANNYQDGTQILDRSTMSPTLSSEQTAENEMELRLNSSVRTISRGGMPTQGAAMFIQGINSLNINAQPLVIVDGVHWDMQFDRTSLHQGFYNNILSLIDTEDIEDIQVLKNGTALYGAEGANGVIIINTKRGKSQEVNINARIFGGFEMMPSTIKMMNAEQYRSYITEKLGTTYAAKDLYQLNTNIDFMNPSSFYYPQYGNETNWQDGLYRNAFSHNYRIGVQGGDDIAKYNLSLGYSSAQATAKNNDYNRLNIRFNTDINLFKNFTTELDMGYVRTAYNLLDNGWAEDAVYDKQNISSPNVLGLIQSPFLSKYSYYTQLVNGKISLLHTDKVLGGKEYGDGNNTGKNPFRFAEQFGYEGLANPYWILENGKGNNKNYQEQTQFLVNLAPKYQINRSLYISDRFSYILTRSNERLYMPTFGTPRKQAEGLGVVYSVLQSQVARENTIFNDLRIDWRHNYGSHTVNVFGGFRFAKYGFSTIHLTAYNNDNDKMPNMTTSQQYKSNGGANDSWVNLTYYLNADYNYRNRYFLKAIVSAEASSRFGKEAGGLKVAGVPWGIFPSIQAAWVMSNESWFKVDGINYLRLSAGWEMSGNDNIDYYAARSYFANRKFLNKLTSLELANIGNSKIQWETTQRANVGLDLRTLNNRLNLGINYYYNITKDLLTLQSVSDITGVPYMWSNNGELRNHGVEVSLHGVLINKKNWTWQAGFSVGHYQNEITNLAVNNLNEIKSYSLDQDGAKDQLNVVHGYLTNIYGANIITAVGQSVGSFYGYKTEGIFANDAEASTAGKYGYLKYPTGLADTNKSSRNFMAGDVHFTDVNGDGWINEADMVVIGNPNPDFFGNLWTSLRWKDLTLDVNLKYSIGNDVFNYQRMQLESGKNIYNQTTAVCNRWKNEVTDGSTVAMPRIMDSTSDYWVNNERFSDRWIEDGSYLKIKKIRLTYKIPVETSWLHGMNVWGEANNVFTVSKYLGLDPEVTAANGVLYQGIDTGKLPSNRNFNIGLTLNL